MNNIEGIYELKIFTENSALKKKLQENAKKHNLSYSNNTHADSGFDLYTPRKTMIYGLTSEKINMEVNCAMNLNRYKSCKPVAYFLYSRSITGSKTQLRLANSVGIIDSGYRGDIQAVFDNITVNQHMVEEYTRLVQICAPNLEPFMVTVVDRVEDLGNTERGKDGFGSTGK